MLIMLLASLLEYSYSQALVWLITQEYEPTGTTPCKSEPEVPTKATIESLRAKPVESLVEAFRENNSYESFAAKESKPQQLTRSPLSQVN